MPRIGVTVYDLLLSCPGDVLDLKEIIDSCVKSFNSSIGEANKIRIELKHWSTDSFSQLGDKPQKLLNRQFIEDCDLCVALLGTRFGTPTDDYDSGTEEEIEKMLEQNKQVFLYFVERNIDPSKIDFEQYSKVKKFREKYTDKGIYTVVKSAEELRSEFQNALSLYFIKLVAPHTPQLQPVLSPNLVIGAENMQKDACLAFHTGFQNSVFVEEKRDKIKDLIEVIASFIIIPSSSDTTDKEISIYSDEELKEKTAQEVMEALDQKLVPIQQYYRILGTEPPKYEKVVIGKTQEKVIVDFCTQNGIKIDDNFFYLGNLQKEIKNSYFSLFGNCESYVGSDSEKEKQKLIDDVISYIAEYNDTIGFFRRIDNLPCISLIVENNGNTYDEDIDVKLFFEKGCLVDRDGIPTPELGFLEDAVDMELPKYIFAGHSHSEINDFSCYPKDMYLPQGLSLPFMTEKESSAQHRKRYKDLVDHVFCYDTRETRNSDILCFNIPYLKQNTKMFIPSFLFFVRIPEVIQYEIRAKRSPEVYRGSIPITSGENA